MSAFVKNMLLCIALSSLFVASSAHAQMGEVRASANDQLKTASDCKTDRNLCLLRIKPEDYSEPTQIKMRAECETTYSACMTGVVDTTEPNTKTTGYQIPDASSLDQFNGLSAQQVVGNIMATAMRVMGSIAFAMMVFAGFLWMTAAGNSDKSRKARDIMVWSALGVIVILSSYSLVKLVFDAFAN